MRISARVVSALAGILLLAATASAQNWVANGNFDANAGSWTLNSADSAIAFDAAFGNPAPGSMRVTNSSAGGSIGTGVLQCLGAVTPGKQYTWGGRVNMPGGQNRTGNLQIGLRWLTGPGCTGNSLDQPRLVSNLKDTWDIKSETDAAPAGAASVMYVAFPSKVEAGGALFGYFDSLFFKQADGLVPPCVADAVTLCLNSNRFSLTATWRTSSASGPGTAVPLTGDTGAFWFFSSNNLEGIFKLVTGCPVNNFYWFFGGGLTNVEVTLRAFDTTTGTAAVYVNPLNTAFQPIQDTSAFKCP
jgi:hypothetical protein